jgi:hypothetical protein
MEVDFRVQDLLWTDIENNVQWLISCVDLKSTQDAQIKHCFWICPWRCFWKRLVFQSVTLIALPCVGGLHLIQLRPWIEQEAEQFTSFLPTCLSRDLSSSASHLEFHHWLPWFFGLWNQAELYYCFSKSIAYRWQIMGLLSFHNFVSQFSIINLFLCSISLNKICLILCKLEWSFWQ